MKPIITTRITATWESPDGEYQVEVLPGGEIQVYRHHSGDLIRIQPDAFDWLDDAVNCAIAWARENTDKGEQTDAF